ncbi:MAG: hydroxyacylglutathione hydrolase [Alphaproteobacteria bacterium]
MSALEIVIIPIFNDNYVYLLYDHQTKWCGVVDPGHAAAPMMEAEKRGWKIKDIIITHHHADHVGGIFEIEATTGAAVIGAANDKSRIPLLSKAVYEGDVIHLGSFKFNVIETNGHTNGHICFVEYDENIAFVGDTLFVMGCGRLFEGTPQQMLHSMKKLMRLPKDMKIYCTHEYALNNAHFALSIDPDNDELHKRINAVKLARDRGEAFMPSTIGEELETNPFFRSYNLDIAQNLEMVGASELEVFTELRHRRDFF